jgi:hypothetical protein
VEHTPSPEEQENCGDASGAKTTDYEMRINLLKIEGDWLKQ